MGRLAKIRRAAAYAARPYFRHELPGWGKLYRLVVGTFAHNEDWRGAGKRWVRGKLHGYDMQVNLEQWSPRLAYFLGRFYDLPTQLVLQRVLRPGDTFVDIGANQGMVSLLAARLVGEGGKVVAFEPNPTPRAAFEAAIERNRIPNIDLRPIGLGDAEATLTLTVPKANTGEGSFGAPAYDDAQVDRIDCPVRLADNELAGIEPRLVKIDVEGFEAHALRGMTATIERARPIIVMEMISKHLENAGSSIAEVAELLTARGYRAWRVRLGGSRGKPRLALGPAGFADSYRGDVLWVAKGDPLEPAFEALAAG